MQKIITLFQRNYETDRLVRNEVTPGAEWVLAGEGVATRKFDGTCCLVKAGKLFKRYDAKRGKTPPPNFVPEGSPDPHTGHWPGWVPVNLTDHYLIRHGAEVLPDAPRDFEGLKTYLQDAEIEGIVWHHPDGRKVKIKAKDFGIRRKTAL